jgi:hypothetical protein
MNTRPTFHSTAPREVRPFNYRYDRRTPESIPMQFDAEKFVSDQAVAAIYKAFTQTKTSHDSWRSYKREGRLDPRRAAAGLRGEMDIFQRKTGRSTTKVKVSVLIDASGSMGDANTAQITNPNTPTSRRKVSVTARLAAAVFGATIAKALGRIPTVDLDIYQHDAGLGSNMTIKWRWHRGTPLGVFNEAAAHGLNNGGNADGHAIYAVTTKMLRDLKHGQKGIIMMVSDGMPSVYAHDGKGQAGQALIDAVAFARKRGIEVIAVAVDGSDQSIYYGKDGVVPFNGEWAPLGTELAKHVGKALARR